MNIIALKNVPLILLSLFWAGCVQNESRVLLRAPVVGIIQNNRVPVLIKTVADGKVRIEYKSTENLSSSRFTEWQKLSEDTGHSMSLILTDLEYNTEYEYRVEHKKGDPSEWFKFRTFPTQGIPGKFKFVFSACLREKYMGYDVFDRIERIQPTFVALLGDQMYADYDGNLNDLERYLDNQTLQTKMAANGEMVLNDKTVLEAFRNKYDRVFDENYQEMASRIPLMAIWDDHDYGKDNSDGTYPYKMEARKAFKENYPDYEFIKCDGGIYYKFSVTDVDVFVLDTRWYRSPMQNEDSETKTMLGREQLDWFLNGLKKSNAKFRIVFSSVSLNEYGGDTSSGRDGFDNWMSYTYQRGEIFQYINDNDIKGVMVFSGDQHYPSAHILNWKSPLNPVSTTDVSIEYSLEDMGNAVFDFSASPLNYKIATGHPIKQTHQESPGHAYEIFRPEWAKPENKKPSDEIIITSVYGVVEMDTSGPEANVSVKFFELNPETTEMAEIYQIKITD
ncbi:MAG TPA: hypothetical protein EYQ50_29835 [Verrucomicrobiales bacterium]|nr:hypothetical protein [Verrucomicrobiales bacterium]